MSASSREQLLLETLESAASTLIDDFDVIDFLQDLVDRSAAILEAADVGIVLADADGQLAVLASTSERLRLIEALQLTVGGPCVDAFNSGDVVTAGSVTAIKERWPEFSPELLDAGFRSAHAVPLRLRQSTIGSLNFFRERAGELFSADERAAQTLAAVAAIGLVREGVDRRTPSARDQLQDALAAQVLVEQAKGVIAHSHSLDMNRAWQLLRQHARDQNARAGDVARAIVDGRISL